MQKSWFGRTVIDGKMSFGGKLGPMLTLRWLVRVQFGVKMGKLTRFGGPKSVPRASKSAPRASQERKKALCSLHLGCIWVVSGLYLGCIWVVCGCQGLRREVVRRSWEAGGRGKERVNLSDIGHHGLLVWNLAALRQGAGGLNSLRATAAPLWESNV